MTWDEISTKVLADCGRCCCLCRQFKPIRLQVHHIVPKGEGGQDELDNAIALCLDCHTDVHTKAPFTRGFTVEELKAHRDNVYRLVAEGNPPAGELMEGESDEMRLAVAETIFIIHEIPSDIPGQWSKTYTWKGSPAGENAEIHADGRYFLVGESEPRYCLRKVSFNTRTRELKFDMISARDGKHWDTETLKLSQDARHMAGRSQKFQGEVRYERFTPFQSGPSGPSAYTGTSGQ